ncbi:hypothetical protein [Pinirhizobacter sp.]|jgi:hypothetical protein|uniref:hypothetical protein n=1 Tax=Pinirhizobacter sp. TaxID=2950432 RepID=UPI002F41B539
MKRFGVLAFLLVAGYAQAFEKAPVSAAAVHGDGVALSTGPTEDIRALRDLFSKYQAGVKQKDARTVLSLYLNESAPVISALAAKSYAVIVAANPKQSIPRTTSYTAKDSVPNEVKNQPDETSNLTINTDGTVGAVSFDYVLAQGNGHGRISWSVIRTNDGWKIAAVLFSINIPAADKT